MFYIQSDKTFLLIHSLKVEAYETATAELFQAMLGNYTSQIAYKNYGQSHICIQ